MARQIQPQLAPDMPAGRRHWPEPSARHQALAILLILLALGAMTLAVQI